MSTAVEEVEWISLGPASKRLGVSRDTVRDLIRDGRLTKREVPGAWVKVPLHEVEALAEKCTTPAQGETFR
jgi:excisionase family DNA binding protein